MSTFAELVTDCQDISGEYGTAISTMFRRWINDGQQDIATRYQWPFLLQSTPGTITTTADDAQYDLDSSVALLYNVYDTTNDRPLDYVTNAEFDKSYPDPSATGAPRWYRLNGESGLLKQIFFYPIPAGAYTIRYKYYKTLSNLVETSDQSAIPARYHKLLVWFALKNYWLKQGDTRYNVADVEYENGLRSMVEELGGEPTDKISVLKSADTLSGEPPVVRLPVTFQQPEW